MGGLVVCGIFVFLGLVDAAFTYLRFGLHRIVVSDTSIELVRPFGRLESFGFEENPEVRVVASEPSLLEYISAAYTEYGEVEITCGHRRSSMSYLIKDPDECAVLERQIRELIADLKRSHQAEP